jgi:hypothetical protein
LDSRDDCVASENAGLGARVDGTEPPIEGEYIGWEQELTDNNDDDSN